MSPTTVNKHSINFCETLQPNILLPKPPNPEEVPGVLQGKEGHGRDHPQAQDHGGEEQILVAQGLCLAGDVEDAAAVARLTVLKPFDPLVVLHREQTLV